MAINATPASEKIKSSPAPGQCIILNKPASTIKELNNPPEINAKFFIFVFVLIFPTHIAFRYRSVFGWSLVSTLIKHIAIELLFFCLILFRVLNSPSQNKFLSQVVLVFEF